MNRRRLLATLAGAVTLGLPIRTARAAQEPVEIGWDDFIPEDGKLTDQVYESLGVVEHDQIRPSSPADANAPITHAFDGKRVRLPGYVVPLDFSDEGVTSFILVPYVGACIHVPPPPANQLVLVSSEKPHRFQGLFEPVWVTGIIESETTSTDLADIGYVMAADTIAPYE